MRGHHWLMVAALTVGLPATAMAQDETPAPPPTTTTTTTITTTTDRGGYANPNEWLVSGFVGSNFGQDAESSSVTYGGQLAYLWNRAIGAEFLADFTPNFQISNVLLADTPNVNTYMVNAIAAVPVGIADRFQPYLSGGFGGIQMRSDVFNIDAGPGATVSSNQTKAGADIGAGIMGFASNVGVRADVRYFHAFGGNVGNVTNATTSFDQVTQNLLSGLDFWRANLGLAVRW